MAINPEDFLQELKNNLESRDVIKAQVLMSNLEQLPPAIQQQVFRILKQATPDMAIPLLIYLLDKAERLELDRENIQTLLLGKINADPESLLVLLEDVTSPQLPLFVDIAGDLQYAVAVPALLDLLKGEHSPALLEKVLKALGKIGEPSAVNTITEYLYSGDRTLVLAAVEALESIGTFTAVNHLAERLGHDDSLDARIVEALGNIQSEVALEKLNAAIQFHNAGLRKHAKSKLIAIGPKVVPLVTQNLLQDDPDLVIHSLNILGAVGDVSAVAPIRKLLYNEPKDSNIRFAAYEALGMLPLTKGAYMLADGLLDPDEQVRTAAARAVERNLDPILLSGIRNLLRMDEETVQRVVPAFLNAEADTTFEQLLDDDSFLVPVLNYLVKEAHPDLRHHYELRLQKLGRSDLARKLAEAGTPEKEEARVLVYAVDDSRMVLNIYRRQLHELGVESRLFEFPESALEAVMEQKPQVLFTDLNMPVITGVELTRRIREVYSPEELPIYLVTTQSDLQDHQVALSAGVTAVLNKPFTAEQLADCLSGSFQKENTQA